VVQQPTQQQRRQLLQQQVLPLEVEQMLQLAWDPQQMRSP
jgi:hypothetical protein